VSFYHYIYIRRSNSEPITFSEFFDRYYQGEYGYLWHEHVSSWLIDGITEMGDKLMVIRFEDLKADTCSVITQVTKFLGIPTTKASIETAIDEAKLEKARKIEKRRWEQKGLGTPTDRSSFYRGGVTGQWEKYFSESNSNDFLEKSLKALQLGEYPT
jgi:hypothetical protein